MHILASRRTLRLFRGLRVLVHACLLVCKRRRVALEQPEGYSFLPSLCWSMVLLAIFMIMGALMLGNLSPGWRLVKAASRA